MNIRMVRTSRFAFTLHMKLILVWLLCTCVAVSANDVTDPVSEAHRQVQEPVTLVSGIFARAFYVAYPRFLEEITDIDSGVSELKGYLENPLNYKVYILQEKTAGLFKVYFVPDSRGQEKFTFDGGSITVYVDPLTYQIVSVERGM